MGKKYDLGEIIFVKNRNAIGSEFLGDHYAIVVNKDNYNAKTLKIMWITSKKGKYVYELKQTISEYIKSDFSLRRQQVSNDIDKLIDTQNIIDEKRKKIRNSVEYYEIVANDLLKKTQHSPGNKINKLIIIIKAYWILFRSKSLSKKSIKLEKMLDDYEKDSFITKKKANIVTKKHKVLNNSEDKTNIISYAKIDNITVIDKSRVLPNIKIKSVCIPKNELREIIKLSKQTFFANI